MVSYREIVSALRSLELNGRPAIAHASLSAFGEVRGGSETLLGALLTAAPRLMMPAFTYRTMLVPETGPAHNALAYGSGADLNQQAEFFRRRMPADPLMGILAEKLRQHPKASRSAHPILSFTAVGLDDALDTQTLADPLGPIPALAGLDGWVLLLGVSHSCNTSIHYAELLAGRKQFIRWALTTDGVRACPKFPGCSQGFAAVEPYLRAITRSQPVGEAWIHALPLRPMVQILYDLLVTDPLAFLCADPDCERCGEVRRSAFAARKSVEVPSL